MEPNPPLTVAVAGRLKAFIGHKQLNTNRASQKLGYGNSTKLHKILSGSQGPSLSTLAELGTTFPDLSLDWLVLGIGQMERDADGALPSLALAVEPARPPALRGLTSGRVLAVTVDRMGHENILHVPAKVQAGYSYESDEPKFLSDLTPYSLPMFTTGTFRSFDVQGDSMEPTIGHRDVVVCQWVERWDLLAPDHVYVIVVDGNVYLKRLVAPIRSRRDDVELHSDNVGYRVHRLPAADIKEIWQVRALISTNIPGSAADTHIRILEAVRLLGVRIGTVAEYLETNAPAHAPATGSRSYGPPAAS